MFRDASPERLLALQNRIHGLAIEWIRAEGKRWLEQETLPAVSPFEQRAVIECFLEWLEKDG